MVEVADLVAKLRADVADFTRKFEQAGQSIKKVETATGKAQASAQQFGTELSRLPGPLGQVASRASSFAGILTGPLGVVAGLAAVVGGLTALIRHTVQTGEELRRLSIITGQSVETLSALRLAAETNETSLQEVAHAMGFLQRAIAEAGTGNEELLRLFTALGVAVRDLRGDFRPTEAVMEDVAKSMQRLSSDAERSRVVMALFGRGGRELMPLLDDLAKRGFAGVREEAQRLNLVLSTEAANAADALGDKFTTLRLRLSSLAVSIGNQLIPALNDLLTILQHPRWELFAAMGAALTGNWQGALIIFRELQKELRQMESLDVFRQQRAGERGLMPPTIRLPDEAALRRIKELNEALLKIEIQRHDETLAWQNLNEVLAKPYLDLLKQQKELEAELLKLEIQRHDETAAWQNIIEVLAAPILKARELEMFAIEAMAETIEDLVRIDETRLKLLGEMNKELKQSDILAGLLGKDFDRVGAQIQILRTALETTVAAWVQAFISGNVDVQRSLEQLLQDIQNRLKGLTPLAASAAQWTALVSSVLGSIDQMVIGVLRGTQTMEEAFEHLVENIILSMMSQQLMAALKPLLDNFGGEVLKFMEELGKESGNVFGTAFGQSLALIGTAMVASQINKINQDPGANKAAGEIGTSIGAALGLGLGITLSAYLGPLGPVIGMALGSAIGGAVGRGINKSIPSIGAEMQARLNEIFAPWFARFEDDMAGAGEEAGKALMTGVQKGAEAIGLGSFVRELGFERMHVKDFEEILKPILEATANLTSAGLQAGLRQGTAEEGFQAFQASIYQGVRTAIITALSQGAAFQAALAPLIAVLQTQTGEALMLGIASAVEFMVTQIAALEPIFNALFEAWQAIEAGIPDIEAPDISAPDTGGFEESAEDLANSIDQLIQDLHRATAEIQGLDAEVANLAADLALIQSQMDRTRVEMETATDPSEVVDLARELMNLTIDYYETQMDLATALYDEILRREAALRQGLSDLVSLTLEFRSTSAASLELAYELGGLISAFDDVETKLAIFESALEAVGQAAIQAATSGNMEDIQASIGAIDAAMGALSDAVGLALSLTDPEAQLNALQLLGESFEQLYKDTLTAIGAFYDRVRAEEQEASAERIEALQAQRDAITETLDAQLDAARETLKVVQEWKRVAEGLERMLLDLQLGTFAPPNPMAAFGVAQSEFDAAIAAFRASGTPETAQAVQDLAQRLLQEASEVFARPSPEYAALFMSITAILDEVNAVAQTQAATEEELLAEIASLDQTRNEQLAAINAAIKAEQDALQATMERIAADEARTVAEANAYFEAFYKTISDAELAALNALNEQIIEQTKLLEDVIGEGNTYEAFIADLTQQEVDALNQIDADLKALLAALGISLAEGTDYVPKTGPYLLHQGEQVIPAGISAGGVYIAPGAIVISGVSDPDRAAELVMEKFYRSLRGGKGRRLVEKIK